MSLTLEDIAKVCNEGRQRGKAGLIPVCRVVQECGVASIPAAHSLATGDNAANSHSITNDIVLKEDFKWITLYGDDTIADNNYAAAWEGENGQERVNVTLNFHIPVLRENSSAVLDKLHGKGWYVVPILRGKGLDGKHLQPLIGDLYDPAKIMISDQDNPNGYNVAVTATMDHKPYFYKGAFEAEETTE